MIQRLNIFICAFLDRLRFTVILYHGLFVPRTKSIFAPRLNESTSLLNKFLGRSEATSYASKEMTMERNDPQQSLRIISETIVLHHQVWARFRLKMCFQVL